MWRRIVDCLGVKVGITSHPPELDALLEAVLRSYAEAPAPADLEYRLEVADWPRLVRDGELVKRQDFPADLVPSLELDLYTQVMRRGPHSCGHTTGCSSTPERWSARRATRWSSPGDPAPARARWCARSSPAASPT